EASLYLSRSHQAYLRLEDLNGASQAILGLARLCLEREEYLYAINLVLPQLEIIEDLQAIPLRRDAYKILSQGHAAWGQPLQAYQFQSLYIKDDQALRTEEAVRRITLLRGQFDFEAKNRELQILQERSEKNRLRIASLVTSLIVLFLIACLVVVFVLYRSQNQVTHILTAQKQEIEAKNRELARTNSELADFAHAASHDLKQPLRTINSYAGQLQRRYASQLDPSGQDFLAYITKGTANMWTLLNDLLAYARFGRQEEALVDLSVEDLLREVTQSLRQQIRESGASFFWSHMPTLSAYRSGLYQLFLNLISNAIKFRGQDPPQIVLGYQETPRSHIFMIRDNGIGIDPAYQDKIFQAFQRLNEQERYPGTGLGLAIVLKAVQMHQGRIWVDSIPDQGSTFWVELPKELRL
ncbi:MAG: ATP-binding protein, partial [Bacteroidota bacterium]